MKKKTTSTRQIAVVALLCAAVGGAAAVLWFGRDGEHKGESDYRSAARIERIGGDVGIARLLEETGLDAEYERAALNMPLTVGDRLYAGEGAQASVAFTGRNAARLERGAALDVLGLTDRRTQLALRSGRAVFDLHDLSDGEYYEVATPYGAFELREPGFYEVGYDDEGGGVFLSVLNGAARFMGLAGSGDIGRGEVLSLLGQTAADIALTRLNPDYAGGLIDDYYAYQYPDIYDGRYQTYDAYLEDPFYYDPYQRYESYRHVSSLIPGVRDLDRYGIWQEVAGHGQAWRPQVEEGWAPYREGYWMLDDLHGMTWVSTEEWGYAPYHYGRWVNSGGHWYWIPEDATARPAYAPALVAFVPLEGRDEIGWVPLGPGDPYAPVIYGPDWQPLSTNNTTVVEQVVNLFVPGALTVTTAEDLGRSGARPRAAGFDPRTLGSVRAVLDPLAVDELRAMSLNSNRRGNRIRVPREVLESYANSDVFFAEQPAAVRADRDRARALRVASVPAEGRERKLEFKEERRAAREEEKTVRRAVREETKAARDESRRDAPAGDAPAIAAPPAGRNDRAAQRQQRELRRSERARRPDSPPASAPQHAAGRAEGERPVGRSTPSAEGERVGGRGPARRAEERAQPAPPARPAEPPRGGGRPEARQPRNERTPPGQARRQQSAAPQPQGPPAQAAPARPDKPKGPPAKEQGGGKGNAEGKGKGKGRP